MNKYLRCIGHYLDDDVYYVNNGGKKDIDKTSFALLLTAIENGLKEFTLKVKFF